jgi:hypothetical protein
MSVSKVCRLLLVAALLCGADDIANAAPNSDVYGEIPDFEGIRISPDGQKTTSGHSTGSNRRRSFKILPAAHLAYSRPEN